MVGNGACGSAELRFNARALVLKDYVYKVYLASSDPFGGYRAFLCFERLYL